MIRIDTTKLIADLAKTVLDDPTPDQFLSHIVNSSLASIEARGAILGIVEKEGFLDLVGSYGYPQNMVDPFTRIPMWTPMPITDAIRNGEISIYYSPNEVIAKYPHLKGFGDGDEGITISVPIKLRNIVIGAIGFTSLKEPSKDFQSSETTQGVMALCGIYMRNLLAAKTQHARVNTSGVKNLTPRQKQIIALFEEQLTTDEMAEKLKYSSSTIKQDIIKIYNIFGVNTRTAVIELAKRAGLS